MVAETVSSNMTGSLIIIIVFTTFFKPLFQSVFLGFYFYFTHLLIEDAVVISLSLLGITTYSKAMNGKLLMVVILMIIEILFFINIYFLKTKVKLLQGNISFFSYWTLLFVLTTISLLILHFTSINMVPDDQMTFVQLANVIILYSIIHFLLVCLSNILKFNMIKTKNEELVRIINFYGQTTTRKIQWRNDILKRSHDLKNTYVALRMLAEDGDINGIVNKLNEELQGIQQNSVYCKSGIRKIDDIVNYKINNVTDRDITYIFNYSISEQVVIDAFDCVVLIGNILDNAIEATRKVAREKTITISIIVDRNIFLMEVKNPFDGIAIIKEDGTNETTKHDKSSHGYGIKSIRTITDKYSGVSEFSCGNGFFTTMILLYQKQGIPDNIYGGDTL
ncbi:GHKL domain-containing protein [Paenibacillus macerans]|nr:ATP-binding protein [Paenibacillus macerans]MED4955888.1 GHKL domain-containing protein [Paenibacillus macerans]